MINVDTLYSRIKDLARKDKGGYLAPDEFNRHLVHAQMMLYEYYFSQYEKTQTVPDRLRPFVVLNGYALSSLGKATLPSDYKHTIRGNFLKVTNVPGGEPSVTKIAMIPLRGADVNLTLDSAVRQPNIAEGTVYYRVIAGYWQVYADLGGAVEMEYFRTPTTPVWGATLDSTNDEYNYDSSASTQLEWDAFDEGNFVDLLLLLYGLPTRQTEIIQWVGAKSQLNKIAI